MEGREEAGAAADIVVAKEGLTTQEHHPFMVYHYRIVMRHMVEAVALSFHLVFIRYLLQMEIIKAQQRFPQMQLLI